MFAGSALGGSLADIEHVVLFMQENRAFDHYFGTMAGVRGFSDPNVQVNSGKPVWQQEINADLTINASYLLPWYINYEGGEALNSSQCMLAGSNSWEQNHAALNGGLNNHWAINNTPWSWGHYRRSDIPVQFSIADGWTIGDMYQESAIASTNPNRVFWTSGSINVPGSPQTKSEGGYPYIDNNETPGCEDGGYNCYPLYWETTPEIYQNANISWSIFQDADNFDDNPLAWFAKYQDAAPTSELYKRGIVGQSLNDFYAHAKNGTLPAISFIVGPAQLSEHPPYSPRDGAWLQKQIVDAITQGAGYPKTALLISYDETGGWGDHVVPYHSPAGTAGEWLDDPYKKVGYTYSGPGFRLPFYIVSPWTRGGNVFTEHADHNSQILFIEEWMAAKGKNVRTNQMVPWRRQHMSSLVNAFDFQNPDFSIPNLPHAPQPHKDAQGNYDGASFCESLYGETRPQVPYMSQVPANRVNELSEQGFKAMRGAMTEGRYVVFEKNGFASTNTGRPARDFTASKVGINHDDVAQRWVLHGLKEGGNKFTISSAADGRYIGAHTGLVDSVSGAEVYEVGFKSGEGYSLKKENGKFVSVDTKGEIQIVAQEVYWKAFSVT
ncbi:phosphoesterase family-domain-containing protein [Tricladium varicosporioides]|nr:phosphoesterase family-domain-containing protein [Hymenoscyphus varicosporioides]